MKSITLAKHFFIICILIVSCTNLQPVEIKQTATSLPVTPTIVTPAIIRPTETLSPTETPIPVPTSTPVGSTGYVIYMNELSSDLPFATDLYTIVSPRTNLNIANITTNEAKVLITVDDLYRVFGIDFLDSYFITLSPDATKLLISFCIRGNSYTCNEAGLYVTNLDLDHIVKLEADAGFQIWSPDSAKLVGVVNGIVHFIDADGNNAVSLNVAMPSDVVWAPDASGVYIISQFGDLFFAPADGSQVRKIKIENVTENHLACMQFSPDGRKVAFLLRSSPQQLVLASADFSKIDFSIELVDGPCRTIEWSPNQGYLSILFYTRNNNTQDIVFDIDSRKQIDLPFDGRLCGWSPDSKLGILSSGQLLLTDMGTNQHMVLDKMLSCPIAWVNADHPSLLSNTNWGALPLRFNKKANCFPGNRVEDQGLEQSEDEKLPGYLDILEVITSLDDSKTLTITLRLRDVPEEITTRLNNVQDSPNLYYYVVYIDVDDNFLTGGRKVGAEKFIIVKIFRENEKLYGEVLTGSASTSVSIMTPSRTEIVVDKDAKTITFSAIIREIESTSYLVFRAYGEDDFPIMDTVCE